MKKIVLIILLYRALTRIFYGQLSAEQINTLKKQLAKAKYNTTSLDLALKSVYTYRFPMLTLLLLT